MGERGGRSKSRQSDVVRVLNPSFFLRLPILPFPTNMFWRVPGWIADSHLRFDHGRENLPDRKLLS